MLQGRLSATQLMKNFETGSAEISIAEGGILDEIQRLKHLKSLMICPLLKNQC